MPPHFVLLHSPSLGPRSWQPVADQLRAQGCAVTVPSLLGVAEGPPPTWPRVAAAVRGALDAVPEDAPLVLVAHSNAGLFVPLLRSDLGGRVAGCVLVDAALAVRSGEMPMLPDALLQVLQGMARDGVLPPWTDWWDEAEIAPMFPDEATRQAVTAEQPRLPLTYYQERVPVPAGWDTVRCAYLRFSEAYEREARAARERGWPVAELPGRHLHQLVDPEGVARLLRSLSEAA